MAVAAHRAAAEKNFPEAAAVTSCDTVDGSAPQVRDITNLTAN
jgi:hypothetical protein